MAKRKRSSPTEQLLKAFPVTDDPQSYYPGEPAVVPLYRFHNSQTLSGSEWVTCCACGYRHLFGYFLFIAPNGQPCLTVKAWADPRTLPKKPKRKKR